MTTKTTTLRAIDLIHGLDSDGTGVPFRWLTSLVEKVRTMVPDDEEASCVVHGAARLAFIYQHTLSPTEELQAHLAAERERLARLQALIPRDGPLTAEQADKLRELLK